MKDEDLEVIAGCVAAHPDVRGGQHVAMACTAVRVMHRPSGIAVTVMDERSQIKNRTKATKLLRRLVEPAPDLTAEDREALHSLRSTLEIAGTYGSEVNRAIAVLDRLLAAERKG